VSHHDRAQGADGVDLACLDFSENLGEGYAWVLYRIVFSCKKIGLTMEGREMDLISCLCLPRSE